MRRSGGAPARTCKIALMENLRESLLKADYTVDGVLEGLGPLAYSALSRSESVPALRATTGGSPFETLITLFLLQQTMGRQAVAAALPLDDALAAGLREAVDARPR